jgi:hypothetical protein
MTYSKAKLKAMLIKYLLVLLFQTHLNRNYIGETLAQGRQGRVRALPARVDRLKIFTPNQKN